MSMLDDIVVLPAPGGRWRLYNVFARTSLVVDDDALRLARRLADGTADAGGPPTVAVWEVERFTNEDGLLADPSRFVRDPAEWPDAEQLDAEELRARLIAHQLLVDDVETYRATFAPKRNVLDGVRHGNFHQQLGSHLLLRRREDPGAWWVRQKFTDDQQAVQRNLYAAVQEAFLDRFLAERLGPRVAVLDVGCGTGYYSRKMAASGADVLGIDPSEEYVAIAERAAKGSCRFRTAAIGEPGGLEEVPSDSFDLVFMSDALLFYFVQPAPGPAPDLDVLFDDIHRVLRPGGRFVSIEPHSIYWLAPWLGEVDAPFTILTEHARRTFLVTPSPSELVTAYTSRGFAVVGMHEPIPAPWLEEVDPRAYHFATQFPVWNVFELMSTR